MLGQKLMSCVILLTIKKDSNIYIESKICARKHKLTNPVSCRLICSDWRVQVMSAFQDETQTFRSPHIGTLFHSAMRRTEYYLQQISDK